MLKNDEIKFEKEKIEFFSFNKMVKFFKREIYKQMKKERYLKKIKKREEKMGTLFTNYKDKVAEIMKQINF